MKRAKVLTRPVLRDTRVAVPDTNNLPSNSLCRIGIVGRVDPAKNVGLVVRAVAGLDCETVLVVRGGVGVGSKEVTDSILLDGYKLLGDRFRYQGEVSRSDSMKDLDILVVANSFEPMGRTVLEAQLAGVLVVVPDSGGASELVLEAQTGYHFASDDVSSLIGVLRRIISGSDDLDAIRSSAKSRTERLTDPETYATQYMMAIGVM